eukprot:TRINITY_DN34249_c0_g1_i1.p1 TRINITY_DN34249_c0_g1~~TRINITY_DN34249_c0_g1_i1.p1  ORF type:complete len:191 (-),score=48.34 TRINITY_DN34249_c0_g1_i1:104-676(-)
MLPSTGAAAQQAEVSDLLTEELRCLANKRARLARKQTKYEKKIEQLEAQKRARSNLPVTPAKEEDARAAGVDNHWFHDSLPPAPVTPPVMRSGILIEGRAPETDEAATVSASSAADVGNEFGNALNYQQRQIRFLEDKVKALQDALAEEITGSASSSSSEERQRRLDRLSSVGLCAPPAPTPGVVGPAWF